MQRQAGELIRQKELYRVPQIHSNSSIESALIKLSNLDSDALLVMANDKIVGTFTYKDFAKAVIYSGTPVNLGSQVCRVMAKDVAFVTEDYLLEQCMGIMVKLKIHHLPVLRDGKPIALLRMHDIMEALIEDKQFIVSELTKYITGSHYATTHPPLAST